LDLELHQLELKYERLRSHQPRREARLMASIADGGQLVPVIVVAAAEPDRFVLVDGYKRTRVLRKLAADTVKAMCWDLDEVQALIVNRLLRTTDTDSALEQGWLLRELQEQFGLGIHELARRFDRSPSWISRRLAMVRELPGWIQEQVRAGALVPHATMKYLVPLARANRQACERLVEALGSRKLSSRQMGSLYAAYQGGDEQTR